MKYLETLNSIPHTTFEDISDESLNTYLATTFEVTIKDTTVIKDIINMYSFLINGKNPIEAFKISANKKTITNYYKLDLIFPVDGDILNAAVTIFLKLYNTTSAITTELENTNVKDIFTDKLIKDILDLELIESIYENKYLRMNSIASMAQLPIIHAVYPDYYQKLILKKYLLNRLSDVQVATGYLYLDYSISMKSKIYILNVIQRSINFSVKNLNIYIYSVTAFGVILLGIATTKEELHTLIYNESNYVSGKILTDKVIAHANTHSGISTFITDAEDFNGEEFILQTKKFNLIIINNERTIIKS
jgi:hypothetical protein